MPNICPTCSSEIPAEAPQGLCPKCVLKLAGETAVPASPVTPPSVEEIAAAFPQLEILELIGAGGMGAVYKARQPALDRTVALKVLPAHLSRDPAFAERFTREGRLLAKLSHPNIVAIYDTGESNGFPYFLMEFVEGVNLRQAIRDGGFTPEQALSIVPGICQALQYAHDTGVLHRDIKPENILLDTSGKVKIADFGIAKLAGETGFPATMLTATGASPGTPQYMAPEQIEKPETVDHRADIYSLGVVIYEMLTGELPLGRFPPPSEKSNVGTGIDKVVFKALEKERGNRQQSASELNFEITKSGGAEPTPQRTTGIQITLLGFAISLISALAFPLLGTHLGVIFWLTTAAVIALYLLGCFHGWRFLYLAGKTMPTTQWQIAWATVAAFIIPISLFMVGGLMMVVPAIIVGFFPLVLIAILRWNSEAKGAIRLSRLGPIAAGILLALVLYAVNCLSVIWIHSLPEPQEQISEDG